MDSNKQRAGQLGGITTLIQYGTEHMREIGKLGGRPRSPTLEEIGLDTAPAAPINIQGRERTPNSLKELKEAVFQRCGRSGASTRQQVRDDGLDGAPDLPACEREAK